ncbi:MAG: replicative DNA helicase [Cytophagales bacterium]|nr:MAG: replicative DNA helicase [Cytophagales bacterium]
MDNQNSNSFKKTKRKTAVESIDSFGGKMPPQAIELEEAVLGALMLEKNALNEVIDLLTPEIFYKEAHKCIYDAIRALFDKSEPIDIRTVVHQLRKTSELELAGGTAYIAGLTRNVASAANIIYHTRILIEQAIKRELIKLSGETLRDAYENSTDAFNLLDQMEQAIFKISETTTKKNYTDIRSAMTMAIKELESKKDHKDGLTGVPTGFSGLDRITSGWQRSDLVIVAARPAMGKTAFSLSLLRNAAVDFGKSVAIFSLEMSTLQLVDRLISSEAEIESTKLKTGRMQDWEMEQLNARISKIRDAKIFIDDTPALSILELRAKARRLKAQNKIELIVIDYLQLMTGDTSKGSSGNREQEIASISRSLKQLAKELDVPVIALSQLSRAVETRGGDKKPQLSDLRESGAIEQDADMVIFLYRPEYYGITEDAEGNPTQGMGEIIISKHRNGSLGSVNLKFIGKFTKFADPEIDTNGSDSYGSFSNTSGIPNEFDTGSTVTFSSKMNGENKNSFKPPSSEEVPF